MSGSLSLVQLSLSFGAGALSTLSPCVFPLLPIVLATAIHGHHRLGPIAMGAGMVLSFVAAGIVVGALGPTLGIDSASVRSAAGLLLLLLAVVMLVPELSEHTPDWIAGIATRAQEATAHMHPETLHGAFLVGTMLGLVWTPCSGPLLGVAFALIATEGGLVDGGLIMGAFGLGATVPLVVAAYASRKLFARIRVWLSGHGAALRRTFAVLIGVVGLTVLTRVDRWLEARVLELLPESWISLTTAL